MHSRLIDNLKETDGVSDLFVISDDLVDSSDDKRRVVKGMFKFKSATLEFLEIARTKNSLVIFKLNFEFLINKKVSELEILRVVNAFNAVSPLIKTRYSGSEAKKTNITFLQEVMIYSECDIKALLSSHLSILSFAPILFSNALNENNFLHRSVTED
ncbi:hypothetical protein J4G65_13020 [Aeromonas allosaccharophila]|uniref:hypothetical protein n=1 Tax=Aeromonas allosaccharophila TaxID=656 RepID=UPI001BCE656A|nr:hypothetical protein [Aeromonas allosaccharophila]MBS4696383.1 hypothetical protein [Aeromonas allosaccharophila]